VSPTPWLAIIGIGEDGIEGLSTAARGRLAQAELVVGGERHLRLGGPVRGRRLAWPSPIEAGFLEIERNRGRPTAVLASGDPFFFGVGSLLASRFSLDETIVFPALSAFSLAAARLGWALQGCALISLHGRPLETIIPDLQPRVRILALAWDRTTPAKLAELLNERGLGATRLIVFEAMGGPAERRREARAETFQMTDVADLNTIALEVAGGEGALYLPRASGFPDAWFENDGQITRRETRALTLSALAPRCGELLWDIGAGSGSVSIEWLLTDRANRAVAIEKNAERAARIQRNAQRFGVPHLSVVEGSAPAALAQLPPPDAIFIGGGASEKGLIDFAHGKLGPSGRLVVNAVTLETQAMLVDARARLGGELLMASFAEAEPIGRFHGWRPAMPVVQWRLVKR